VPGEPVRNTGRTGIVGGGQSKIAETLLEVGEKAGGFWYCFFGMNGLARPRSSAVFGMNCAMLCAPAGLIVLGRKLLSCHISRVRNATGRL
jgi:hypothetical protein